MDKGWNFKVYVEDNHDFPGIGINIQTYIVQDVPPILVVGSEYSIGNPISLTAGDTTSVSFNARIQDNNGEGDILGGDGVLFDSGAPVDSCTADDHNCYPVPNCTLNSAYGNSSQAELQCTAYVWFNANASTDWKAHINVQSDIGRLSSLSDSSAVQVQALSGLSVFESSIEYGSLSLGATSPTSQTVTLQNVGNQVTDVLVQGTDMTFGTSVLPHSQQHFHESNPGFTYGSGDYALVDTASAGDETVGCLNRNLQVRTTHYDSTPDEQFYWKIQIPTTIAAGTYFGTINVIQTPLDTCTGTLY